MATRINKRRRKAIEEYVTMLLEELGLEDWIVYLSDDMPTVTDDKDESASPTAQIATRPTNRYAILRIGDRFFNDGDCPNDVRTTVLIHEMVHLHFDVLSNFVWQLIDDHVHPSSRNSLQDVATNMEERAIDQVAWAFAKTFVPFKLPK